MDDNMFEKHEILQSGVKLQMPIRAGCVYCGKFWISEYHPTHCLFCGWKFQRAVDPNSTPPYQVYKLEGNKIFQAKSQLNGNHGSFTNTDDHKCKICKLNGHNEDSCKRKGKCYRCQQPGHFAHECMSEPVCFKCNKKGHVAIKCQAKMKRVWKPKTSSSDTTPARKDRETKTQQKSNQPVKQVYREKKPVGKSENQKPDNASKIVEKPTHVIKVNTSTTSESTEEEASKPKDKEDKKNKKAVLKMLKKSRKQSSKASFEEKEKKRIKGKRMKAKAKKAKEIPKNCQKCGKEAKNCDCKATNSVYKNDKVALVDLDKFQEGGEFKVVVKTGDTKTSNNSSNTSTSSSSSSDSETQPLLPPSENNQPDTTMHTLFADMEKGGKLLVEQVKYNVYTAQLIWLMFYTLFIFFSVSIPIWTSGGKMEYFHESLTLATIILGFHLGIEINNFVFWNNRVLLGAYINERTGTWFADYRTQIDNMYSKPNINILFVLAHLNFRCWFLTMWTWFAWSVQISMYLEPIKKIEPLTINQRNDSGQNVDQRIYKYVWKKIRKDNFMGRISQCAEPLDEDRIDQFRRRSKRVHISSDILTKLCTPANLNSMEPYETRCERLNQIMKTMEDARVDKTLLSKHTSVIDDTLGLFRSMMRRQTGEGNFRAGSIEAGASITSRVIFSLGTVWVILLFSLMILSLIMRLNGYFHWETPEQTFNQTGLPLDSLRNMHPSLTPTSPIHSVPSTETLSAVAPEFH